MLGSPKSSEHELEVAVLRTFLKWSEKKCFETYNNLKTNDASFLKSFLAVTEAVVQRVDAQRWVNSIVDIADPVTTTIDKHLSHHLLKAISFVLQSSCVSPPSPLALSDSRHDYEFGSEIEMLKSSLALLQKENEGLHQELAYARAYKESQNLVGNEVATLKSEMKSLRQENEELKELQKDIEALSNMLIRLQHQNKVLEAELVEARDDKENQKALEGELDALKEAMQSLRKENQKLHQDLVDVNTYRSSTEGQALAEVENLLAESNLQNTLLEADNKKLRVALTKAQTKLSSQSATSRTIHTSLQKQHHMARPQSVNVAGL